MHAIADAVGEMLPTSPVSLAVFSASWTIARALRQSPDEVAREFCANLLTAFPSTTIMMPTFTAGFGDKGICDLDVEPSKTGVITEHFRTRPHVRRTRSAFFSFAVSGPRAGELVDLEPQEAWGAGSLYAWMFEEDTTILTVGLHPTHCSFSHFAEWQCRDRIPYRINKSFHGILRVEKRETQWSELLFVRNGEPAPINDFTTALPDYLEHGMKVRDVGGVQLSTIGARTKASVLTERLRQDPFAVLGNREAFSALAE